MTPTEGNCSFPSSGYKHSAGAPAVSATELTLRVDTTGLGGRSDNVGIDNIVFSQVPEPSTSVLLSLGLLGLGYAGRRGED